jgi:hypothetical protein
MNRHSYRPAGSLKAVKARPFSLQAKIGVPHPLANDQH